MDVNNVGSKINFANVLRGSILARQARLLNYVYLLFNGLKISSLLAILQYLFDC